MTAVVGGVLLGARAGFPLLVWCMVMATERGVQSVRVLYHCSALRVDVAGRWRNIYAQD